ncbi:MAG: hypothetical protein AVDCRST_MAG85-1, partial [uncultured Solirubrobacteraceae bacterium]
MLDLPRPEAATVRRQPPAPPAADPAALEAERAARE